MKINRIKGCIVTFLTFLLVYSVSPYHGGAAVSWTLKVFGLGVHILVGIAILICLPMFIEKGLDHYRSSK